MQFPKYLLIILAMISFSPQEIQMNIAERGNTELPFEEEVKYENIEFPSVGVQLRGRLYLPKNQSKQHPLIIMAHGFSATINGMVADRYAEEFCKAGFAVILYDHRNFGISEGSPRQELNYWVQCRGYIDAMNFAHTLNMIDKEKIALWGDSLSSAEAFTVASIDERVKAVIGQVPAFGDEEVPFEESAEIMESVKTLLLNEHLEDLAKEEIASMAVVSSNQQNMSSALRELTAYRWFIEYGGRFDTKWQNDVSFSTFENAPKNYHRGIAATSLKSPVLLVVAKNDEMEGASDMIAKSVFEKVSQPKQIAFLGGGHFGMLEYPSPLFNESSKLQVEFLNKLFNL
jgi:pimeloyl-ACP methyl ester carboxylesterase